MAHDRTRIISLSGNYENPDPANPLLRPLMTVYNRQMDAIMQVLGPVLEWMFFLGMAGSALVIVISFIEDFNTIFEKD